jgi:hypothetical protein
MASVLCTWHNVSFSSIHSSYVSRIAVEDSFDKKGLQKAVQLFYFQSLLQIKLFLKKLGTGPKLVIL